MKVVGLDGRSYSLDLSGHGESSNPSAPHLEARQLLAGFYPLDRRLEEVVLPGTNGLRADFLVPSRRLVVEVQGRQHGEYVPHFHRDAAGYLRSVGRDDRKRRWAELNGFRHVELLDGFQGEWADAF